LSAKPTVVGINLINFIPMDVESSTVITTDVV
jgi:hypothetical protein